MHFLEMLPRQLVSTCVGTEDIYFSRRPDAPAYVSPWLPKRTNREIDISYHENQQLETETDKDQIDENQNESFRTELEIFVSDAEKAKLECEAARDRAVSIPFEADFTENGGGVERKMWDDTEGGEEVVIDVVAEEVAGWWLLTAYNHSNLTLCPLM